MLEQQIGQSEHVFHLDVRLRQDVGLLVWRDQTDRHVCLADGELICLRANHADHSALLASVREVPDCPDKRGLLVGIDRGTDAQASQAAQCEK